MIHRDMGISLDSVARLRRDDDTRKPDPVAMASLAEEAGATQIKVYLREDRRFIRDRDVRVLRETVATSLNLQMAPMPEMLKVAYELKPDEVTLVPELREDYVGQVGLVGLDVQYHREHLKKFVGSLRDADIGVVLSIEPSIDQVRAAHRLDANHIEISTEKFASARGIPERRRELQRVVDTIRTVSKLGMKASAAGGLNYHNLTELVPVSGISQFNLGHAVIMRALHFGMSQAVRDMRELLKE